jgi:hypothetical protein
MEDNNVLFTVCFLCILVIFLVCIVNLFMLWNIRKEFLLQKNENRDNTMYVKQLSDDMDMIISKINNGIKYKVDTSAVTILDLAEFNDLDPYIKEAYKKHIVKVLTPAIMSKINKTMKQKELETYLKLHEKEISTQVYSIAKDIEYNGF